LKFKSKIRLNQSDYLILSKKFIYFGGNMNLKPLQDRVLIKRLETEQKTAGGIIIPDSAKEKPMKGEVVAAGPGKDNNPMTVKAGDVVLFAKYAGNELKIDADEFIIMREDEILAIVE
jgi:chaperonin GroES